MRDVIVVGGGPAGLATALYAHRAGLDVTVVERRSGTLDKACGEGLMPGAVRALRGLGVDVAGLPLRGIRYLDGKRSVDASFRDGPGAGVRRTALYDALDAARQRAGIEVVRASVTDVAQTGSSVRVAGLEARYLVAADGLHSPIRHLLGLDRPTRGRRRWGVRAHFAVSPWSDHVEVHWGTDSEVYVTPVAPDLVGVAVLSSHRGDFADRLTDFPAVLDRLRGARPQPVRGAGPLRQTARQRVAGRVLLVGDAAGYVDALTGEGLAVAFASAAELVRCIDADAPQDYEGAWRRVSRRPRLLTEALLWTAQRPVLRRRIVPAACRLPAVFGLAVNQLAR